MAASAPESDNRRPQGGLQIDEDLRHQRRMWRAERIGWSIMAAILAAAAAGFFGHGPLSERIIEARVATAGPRPLLIAYERFARSHRPLTLHLSHADWAGTDRLSVWFPHGYLSQVEVGQITPEPDRAELVSGGIRYDFTVHQGPVAIVFRFKAVSLGPLTGSMKLNDEPEVNFQQFIFP